jgi:hypothetical protein
LLVIRMNSLFKCFKHNNNKYRCSWWTRWIISVITITIVTAIKINIHAALLWPVTQEVLLRIVIQVIQAVILIQMIMNLFMIILISIDFYEILFIYLIIMILK